MCDDCADENAVLPSVESFQMRGKNPKVYYLFYEYFFRAVVTEVRWKKKFEGSGRFGTAWLEAFAHGLLENNYFAWLFQYKSKYNFKNLKTEYDMDVDDDGKMTDKDARIFCGNLEDVEIVVPEVDGEAYTIVVRDAGGEEYEKAKDAAE